MLFQRAVKFTPDDAAVRVLYGYYYARRGQPKEALAQIQLAEKLGFNDANVQLYLAHSYITLQDYDKAIFHAKRAYTLGYKLPGLKNKLKRLGHWQD
ncbi:MAG: tetratricopeptide repeat protein [Candidatus Competibacteraceae bacterium]|nr:tetratricopeptide repeat protein [Candidatus Competibacteraceae bacterium]